MIVEPLGGRALLEEAGHWRRAGIQASKSLALLLPIHSLLPKCGCPVANQPPASATTPSPPCQTVLFWNNNPNEVFFPGTFLFLLYFCSVHVCVYMYACACTCTYQRTFSGFGSLLLLWVPGVKFGLSDLPGKYLYSLSHLAALLFALVRAFIVATGKSFRHGESLTFVHI